MTNYVYIKIIALLPEPDWIGMISPQVTYTSSAIVLKMLLDQTYVTI